MTKIIRAELLHTEALSSLFDGYRVFYRQNSNLPAAKAFLQARFAKADSVIFLAKTGNEYSGFTQLYPLFSSVRMQRMWLLNDLYVAPSFRGKGISKLLIEAAKKHARDTEACGISLETASDNRIGNRLYPAVGFTLDEDHNYYFWENKI